MNRPLPADRFVVRRLLGALAAVVGTVVLLVSWQYWSKPEPAAKTIASGDATAPVDPRIRYRGPYENLHPSVKYVGDAACVDCHADIATRYARHPMARAMAPMSTASPIEKYSAEAMNPFRTGNLQVTLRKEGDKVWQREALTGKDDKILAAIEAEMYAVVGSGAKARSYVVCRDGHLYQSVATWFVKPGRWDLSPGYEFNNRHFTRPMTPGCMFCHCNQVEPVPGTVNKYQEPYIRGHGIGCERCHGPGEKHVARMSRGEMPQGDFDPSIVNPADLEHSLRESVCQQCHVQGEQRIVARGRDDFDYRPGLPLHEFLMDFNDARDRRGDHKFVSSVEQMMASRCYKETSGAKKLGCISCHDPHGIPEAAEKVAHYRGRCLTCHTETSCHLEPAIRRAKQPHDSCIACHMPETGAEINHTAITDHRIPRNPAALNKVTKEDRSTPGPDDLIPFHQAILKPEDAPEVSRNLGLALIGMLDRGPPAAAARAYAQKALPLLDQALARDHRDWPVHLARGDALWLLGNLDEAARQYEQVMAGRPRHEMTLHGAGNLALQRQKTDDAGVYFERAVAINPWNPLYHHGLAVAAFRKGYFATAEKECLLALELDPMAVSTRSLLVQCYVALGKARPAQEHFEILRELTPEKRRLELQDWYIDQLRRLSAR